MSLVLAFTDLAAPGMVIRTAGTEDTPLFLMKDVCAVLGIVDTSSKARLLRDDDKRLLPLVTAGGVRSALYCTEPGLYSMILSCRARSTPGSAPHKFFQWICHDVLPQIRLTGTYVYEPLESIQAPEEGEEMEL